MINIADHKGKLLDIISPISKLIHMEIAIFDEGARLVCATPTSKKIKGTAVHLPSIREVLEKGNVLVTNPGKMDSCKCCRFVADCPSKIEILASLRLESVNPSVVSITSFDKDDETILKNIKYYIESLELVTSMIEKFLTNLVSEQENQIIRYAHSSLLPEDCLICDLTGRILFNTLNLPDHDMNCAADSHLLFWLDETAVKRITETKTALTMEAKVIDQTKLVGVVPIKKRSTILGHRITLTNPLSAPKAQRSSNALDSLLAVSSPMVDLKETIRKIAKSSSSVVIHGETGTGKELVAKSIHQLSPRQNGPFIAVNCANFPEQLFESEVFGYEEGTFTGGKKGGKIGILEQADGGTVFLDEISELPLFQQTKLLRFIQERTVTRLGGAAAHPVDVRIICATNKDLHREIQKGTFRKDLYYRINVISLTVPALRERSDDILCLADRFIDLYKGNINPRIKALSPEAREALLIYDWPGNVRELENCIECALNIETSDHITINSLPREIRQSKHTTSDTPSLLKDNEKTLIKHYLDAYGWHRAGKEKTAQTLNISLRSLYRKIKDFNLAETNNFNSPVN